MARATVLFILAVVGSVFIAVAFVEDGERSRAATSAGGASTKLGQAMLSSENCPPPCVPHVFDQHEESEMEVSLCPSPLGCSNPNPVAPRKTLILRMMHGQGLMGEGKIVLPSGQEAVAAAMKAATDAKQEAAAAAGSSTSGFVQPQPQPQPPQQATPTRSSSGGYRSSQWEMMHGGGGGVSAVPAANGMTVVTVAGQGQPGVSASGPAQGAYVSPTAAPASSAAGLGLGASSSNERADTGAAYVGQNRNRANLQGGRLDEEGRLDDDKGEVDLMRRLARTRRGGARDREEHEGRRMRREGVRRDHEERINMAERGHRINSKLGALLRLFFKSSEGRQEMGEGSERGYGERGEGRERGDDERRASERHDSSTRAWDRDGEDVGEEDGRGVMGERWRRDEEEGARGDQEQDEARSTSSSALERILGKMVRGREHDRRGGSEEEGRRGGDEGREVGRDNGGHQGKRRGGSDAHSWHSRGGSSGEGESLQGMHEMAGVFDSRGGGLSASGLSLGEVLRRLERAG